MPCRCPRTHAGGSGWPDNTLLYLGASSSSTVSYGDAVVARFGLLVTTDALDEPAWLATLGELAGKPPPSGEEADAAVAWARARGGLTLRTAAMYGRF